LLSKVECSLAKIIALERVRRNTATNNPEKHRFI
jgi:hypothetical protein